MCVWSNRTNRPVFNDVFGFTFTTRESDMRYVMMAMWCVAAGVTATWGRAEGDAEKPAAKAPADAKATGDAKATVEAYVSGRIVTIGPDGKVNIETFGDDGPDGAQADGAGEALQPQLGKVWTFRSSKAFRVGPDGKLEATDDIPAELLETIERMAEGAGGDATPGDVAPNGARPRGTVLKADGAGTGIDVDGLLGMIELALGEQGSGLPQSIRGKLAEAMKSDRGDTGRKPADDSVARKLDLIMERLDKLDRDIEAIKAGGGVRDQ